MKLLNKKIINLLKKKKLKITIAESCTGGLLSNAFTSVSGSSKVFKLGLITYSNESKIKILKVPKKTIKKYGAVSKQVCLVMAKNAATIGKTNTAIAVTGIAGPGGGTRKKPVGLVYVSLKKGKNIDVKKYLFKNKKRSYIQKTTVNKCLKLILRTLK
tara:strand:- start:450 stop:923 length:474 start_codon:yes stop_codon:yes gene_type:complete